MIAIKDKSKCCGCEACLQVCPQQCISFHRDEEGFNYPYVNMEKCVDCGLCEKVCPELKNIDEKEPIHVYAAINNDLEERIQSSSGGLFVLLAKRIIDEHGVVFGARFDDKWNVVHSYTENLEGIPPFMGSKYVQSRIGDNFKKVKEFLCAGRKVMFSGTSCQIAGLKNYLIKDYNNLLTVDVICHGVPSPLVWRQYLEEIKNNAHKGKNTVSFPPKHLISERETLKERYETVIERISFRDKRLGWQKYSFALTLAEASADGKKNSVSLSHIHRDNPFMKVFLSDIILRPSCHKCFAKSGKSGSDITLADFWGVGSVVPEMDDDKGVSLLVVNSERGMNYIDLPGINKTEVTLNDAFAENPAFYRPKKENPYRALFFKDFIEGEHSVISLMKRYTHRPLYKRVIHRLITMVRTLLRFS